MKKLRRFSVLLCMIVFMLPGVGLKVHAASGRIAFSDPTVKMDAATNVTVKITSDVGIASVNLTLAYDNKALQFVEGGNAKESSGKIQITDSVDNTTTTTLTYTLKFKALKTGKSQITVSDYKVADSSQAEISMPKVGSSSVNVVDANASEDATLKILQVSAGKLSPEFSPTTYQYTLKVPESTGKLVVSGKTTDSSSKITSITGADKLKAGKNTVKVVVTSGTGSTQTYTIEVTKAGASGTEEETGEETGTEAAEENASDDTASGPIKIGDKKLQFAAAFPEDFLLEGFTKTSLTYQGEEQTALKSDYAEVYLVSLSDTGGNSDIYVYNKETGSFTNYIKIDGAGDKYIIVLEGMGQNLKEYGFAETSIFINEKELIAWEYLPELQTNASEAYYVMFALSNLGVQTWYMYDSLENSYQRYFTQPTANILDPVGSTLSLTEQEEQIKELTELLQKTKNARLAVILILAFLCAVLLIVVINLALKLKGINRGGYEEDIEDQEDNFTLGGDFENFREEEIKDPYSYEEEDPFDDDFEVKPKKGKQKQKKTLPPKKMNEEDEEDDFDFEFIDLDEDDDEKY